LTSLYETHWKHRLEACSCESQIETLFNVEQGKHEFPDDVLDPEVPLELGTIEISDFGWAFEMTKEGAPPIRNRRSRETQWPTTTET
jgi:hypothetical protein